MTLHAVTAASGTLCTVRGGALIAELPLGTLGSWCLVEKLRGESVLARISGFEGQRFVLTPYDDTAGLHPGARVDTVLDDLHFFPAVPDTNSVVDFRGTYSAAIVPGTKGTSLRARGPALVPCDQVPSFQDRLPIDARLKTGIQTLDTFSPLGRGQRMALLAKPGVGKTTLLLDLAARSQCDLIVLALVGERGREITECLTMLAERGLQDKTIVVATSSDESAGKRALAPFTATAIAEAYQRQGKHVLLLVDSLTRTARAIRDYSLSAGEMPVRQGYTPSVYRELPILLERAGNMKTGSITGFYSLLQEGPDEMDSLASELRSLLDGHIVLSEEFARWGIRPAIDIFQSVSRCANSVCSPDQVREAEALRLRFHRIYERKKMADLGVADRLSEEEESQFQDFCQFLSGASQSYRE